MWSLGVDLFNLKGSFPLFPRALSSFPPSISVLFNDASAAAGGSFRPVPSHTILCVHLDPLSLFSPLDIARRSTTRFQLTEGQLGSRIHRGFFPFGSLGIWN